jgi:uncharacterized protein (DUF2062 family)
MARRRGSATGISGWLRGHIPTRETIGENRWLAPFAHRLMKPDIWHFNRRSVPRAVALGLFVAPIIPVAHTVVAALLALPARANIVIALMITFVINPLTIPPFYFAAFHVGRILLRLDEATPGQVIAPPVHTATHWLAWVLNVTGPAALGTLVLATIASSAGYFISAWIWRFRIARKWRRRHGRQHG